MGNRLHAERSVSHPVRTVRVMFFERRCPVCSQLHRTICLRCVDSLELAEELQVPGLDQATALFNYDDASARLILAAKNGGRRDLLRWAGRHLATAVASEAVTIDIVTWVPAHPEQRRTRGYDQGQILARAVAKQLDSRARPLLQRRSSGSSRKGLDRVDRLTGPDVYARRRSGGNVLLVDDVMATGTSLECCATVLRAAGAERVSAAIVATSTSRSHARSAEAGSTIYIGISSGNRPQAT